MSYVDNSQQQQDVFDILPDALVLEIFNRVQDAKSLSSCMSLCKRFESLVPQTDNVRLTITRRKNLCDRKTRPSSEKTVKGLISRVLFKPIQSFLQRVVAKKPTSCLHCDENDNDDDGFSFSLPNDMLRSFKEIRDLVVQLPSHEGDISSSSGGAFLKWNAEFGKELESCVVLGATGFRKSESCQDTKEKESSKDDEGGDDNNHDQIQNNVIESSNLTNKQLKKRVVWTISCLIAASARHHMLKNIIWRNRMIRDVEISDGSKQGKIRMSKRQVLELRNEMDSTMVIKSESEMERTKIPGVMIKMWYVPMLELPESGYVMKGATLAVIRPVEENQSAAVAEKDDVSLVMDGFGGGVNGERCFEEAVKKLLGKKKAYTLEMNSF